MDIVLSSVVGGGLVNIVKFILDNELVRDVRWEPQMEIAVMSNQVEMVKFLARIFNVHAHYLITNIKYTAWAPATLRYLLSLDLGDGRVIASLYDAAKNQDWQSAQMLIDTGRIHSNKLFAIAKSAAIMNESDKLSKYIERRAFEKRVIEERAFEELETETIIPHHLIAPHIAMELYQMANPYQPAPVHIPRQYGNEHGKMTYLMKYTPTYSGQSYTRDRYSS